MIFDETDQSPRPRGRGDQLVPGPVAPGDALRSAFVQSGADVLGCLGTNHRSQDPAEEAAHELTPSPEKPGRFSSHVQAIGTVET